MAGPDNDETKILPPTPPAPPSSWAQRNAARTDKTNGNIKEHDLPVPVSPAYRHPLDRTPAAEPTLRVMIEQQPGDKSTPAVLVVDASGPREVVATTLLAMARKLDPPWWDLFTHRRNSRR